VPEMDAYHSMPQAAITALGLAILPADSTHSGRLGIVLELRPQIGWNLNRQIAHPVRRGLLLGFVTGDHARLTTASVLYAANAAIRGLLEDDFEACIVTVTHRRTTRSTNLLERLFVEERRFPTASREKPIYVRTAVI